MQRAICRNKDYIAAGGGKFEIKARQIRREILYLIGIRRTMKDEFQALNRITMR